MFAWVGNPAQADALLDDDARFPLHMTRLEFQAALAAYLLLCVCLGYLVGDLFAFHVLLIRRGMTTYEYIVSRREAEDDARGERDGAGGRRRADWKVAKGGDVCGAAGALEQGRRRRRDDDEDAADRDGAHATGTEEGRGVVRRSSLRAPERRFGERTGSSLGCSGILRRPSRGHGIVGVGG